MNHSQQDLLRLHLTPYLGRTALFKIKRKFGDFALALQASAKDWQEADLSENIYSQVCSADDPKFQAIVKQMCDLEVRLISFWDQDYPELLRTIHDPPALIYLRGQLPREDCFAIVGSRRATPGGLATTRKLAAELARHDICIVSGLARGIDSMAHSGAWKPTERPLQSSAVESTEYIHQRTDGCISTFFSTMPLSRNTRRGPPLARPLPRPQPHHQRTQLGVLIVEAAEKSGSLITGDFALEQGRELFAIPGTLHDKNSYGTNRLLKEGAHLVTDTQDILQALWPGRISGKERHRQENFADQLSGPALAVYQLLGCEPLHGDEIARKCGLTPMELSAILLDLELQDGIKALPGHHYIRSRL